MNIKFICVRLDEREPLVKQCLREDEDHEAGLQVRLHEALSDERRAEERGE